MDHFILNFNSGRNRLTRSIKGENQPAAAICTVGAGTATVASVAVENANGGTVDLTEPKPDANLASTTQKTQTPAGTMQPNGTEPASKPVNIATILLVVWGIGAVAVLTCFFATNLHFVCNAKRTRKALPVEGCKLPVYVTERIETPCLIGLFRPAIYLTTEAIVNKTVL